MATKKIKNLVVENDDGNPTKTASNSLWLHENKRNTVSRGCLFVATFSVAT